jgi:hypothetical protein
MVSAITVSTALVHETLRGGRGFGGSIRLGLGNPSF